MSFRLALLFVVCGSPTLFAQGFGPSWSQPTGVAGREVYELKQEPPVLPQREIVENLLESGRDSNIRAIAWKYGLNLFEGTTVEDLYGTGVADYLVLKPQVLDKKVGKYSFPSMPIVRDPALWDAGLKVPLDQVLVFVGNERGQALQPISLKQYLDDPRRHLHDPQSWSSETQSLLAAGETHAVFRFAATWHPALPEGRTECVLERGRGYWDRPVFCFVATDRGTSANLPGSFLAHNNDGTREPYVVQMPARDKREMPRRPTLRSMLVIEVPVKFAEGHAHGFGTNCFPIPREGLLPPIGGRHLELDRLPMIRDPEIPIQITLMHCFPTFTGKIDEFELSGIAGDLAHRKANPESAGRALLVRPESHFATYRHGTPLPWWERFWKNRRESPSDAVARIKALNGPTWFSTSPRRIVAALSRGEAATTPREQDEPPPSASNAADAPREFVDPRQPSQIEISVGESEPVPVIPPERAVHEALSKVIDVSARNVPANEVLKSIGDQIGLAIRIDDARATKEGINVGDPTTLDLKGITARSALPHVLSPLQLTFVREHGHLLVTTATAAGARLTFQLHEVTGLGHPEALVDAVTSIVDPDTWSEVGGAGSIAPLNRGNHSYLAVTQTAGGHDEVQSLLDLLRRGAAGKLGLKGTSIEPEAVWNAHQKIDAALAEKRSLTVKQRPLRDVLIDLQKALGINMRVDEQTLRDEGVDVSEPISVDLKNVSGRSLLSLILEPLQLTWFIEEEVLTITTATNAGFALTVRAYDVTTLGVPAAEWSRRLAMTIDPETWDEVGGMGSFLPIRIGERDLLAIRNTQWELEQCERYLEIIDTLLRATAAGEWTLDIVRPDPKLTAVLERPMNLSIRNAALKNVVARFQKELDVTILIRERDLEDEGIDLQSAVTVDVTNEPLKAALEKMLKPLKLTAFIEHETLQIATGFDTGRRLVTVIHDVTDLGAEVGQLPDTLEQVDRDTWDVAGGWGSATDFKLRDRHVLVIRQSREVHDKVRTVLREFRRLAP